jgi:hypothetical protein
MMRRLAWAVCASLLLAGAAHADTMPNDIDFICTIHHRTSQLNLLDKLPASLKSWIASTIGPMADHGQPFNSTDVVTKGLPATRFLRAGQFGNYWFIMFERGGIAYSKHVVLLHLDLELTQVADKTYAPTDDPCPMVDALLDSVEHMP